MDDIAAPQNLRADRFASLGWRAALVALYVAIVLLLFRETAASIVSIWIRSQTFAHGFLVIPISLWLIWRRYDDLVLVPARPAPWILIVTAAAGVAWCLANMVDVLIIQQLALVAILITGIWALLGTAFVRVIAFPLGFLFMAVPMGEGLIMPLTNLTADTTEYLIRMTGVPLLREGNYLTLPTGKWSVVEACSGIRYLIASVTLGMVYAYIAYQRWWKRAIFVVASIAVPILANSLRAYGVVMLGHISNMKYGVGADHLYYGWILFGIVMLLLFWIGSFWEDSSRSRQVDQGDEAAAPIDAPTSGFTTMTVLFVVVLVAALGPIFSWAMSRVEVPANLAELSAPKAIDPWRETGESGWGWIPNPRGADRQLQHYYRTDNRQVGLFLHQYFTQEQKDKLVSGTLSWRSEEGDWQARNRNSLTIEFDSGQSLIPVQEAVVSSGRQQLLAWTWYRINGAYTSNPYLAKLYEVRQQFSRGYREGSRYFLVTSLEEMTAEEARVVLQDFLNSHQSGIERTLDSRALAPEGSR